MLDIKLNADGDLDVSAFGDISTTESVRQAVLIRLRWIYDEWRLGPEYGFPWFEEVFVKNPNTVKIKQLIREEILKVSEVRAAEETNGQVLLHREGRRRNIQGGGNTVWLITA